jgi:hypothetical protein
VEIVIPLSLEWPDAPIAVANAEARVQEPGRAVLRVTATLRLDILNHNWDARSTDWRSP